MSFRTLLNADSGLSVMLHALKALVALALNWLVLHFFSVGQFVTWSVTSSILVVATASDLGLGQYAVTRMINSEPSEWPVSIGQTLGALMPLVLLSAVFVWVELTGPPTYRAVMAVLLAGRIITIPFVAVLNAVSQFKVRKAIELAAYLVALVSIGGLIVTRAPVEFALLALNLTFFLGALVTAAMTAQYVSIRNSLSAVTLRHSVRVFRSAVPFMANNLTGLLTYGGFVWLCSLVMREHEVAKLAVLHSFVLVNLYQVYDVFLKSRQPDLADPLRIPLFVTLNTIVMLALPVAFLVVGGPALRALTGDRIDLTIAEAGLYGLFLGCELGNLFVQSVTQVNVSIVNRLKLYSALRAGSLGAFLIIGFLGLSGEMSLLVLLALLAATSAITLAYLFRGVQVFLQGSRAVAGESAARAE